MMSMSISKCMEPLKEEQMDSDREQYGGLRVYAWLMSQFEP